MTKDKALKLETRRNIYQFVQKHPGIHFRELCRELNIPRTTLSYHLLYLKKRQILTVKPEDGYSRCYIESNTKNREEKILGLLRQETPRNIVLFLLTHIYGTKMDMSNGLEKHPTTIDFHLKKLLKNKIVEVGKPVDGKIHRNFTPRVFECEQVGKEVIYILKDPWAIYDLILDYLDDLIANGIPEHVNDHKNMLDIVLEVCYDIFPHPYHV